MLGVMAKMVHRPAEAARAAREQSGSTEKPRNSSETPGEAQKSPGEPQSDCAGEPGSEQKCSTSLPGGNLVDGLPPALNSSD